MPALKNVPIEATERAWIEVDPGALRRNYGVLSDRLTAGCSLLPMVKADAYGVGLERVVRCLGPLGPWGFGVATTGEGRELRRLGWEGRVVVFSPRLPTDVPSLVEWHLEAVVTGREALRLSAGFLTKEKLVVHLEVDTGMGRFGLGWESARSWATQVADMLSAGRVRLEGTFTHFHSADTDAEATRAQWNRLSAALATLREAGVDPGLVHAANSAGLWLHEGYQGDLVRPGVYLYGGGGWEPRPEPVVSVRARVLAVRDVPAGTTVGYGATWESPGPARLATLGIGYGDGLRRELSNRGRVLVGGREAPIRGVVCMDTTVVDVTGRTDVGAGDVATILGRDGNATIGLDELARLCDTIDYEILTGWSVRLPRLEIVPRDGAFAGLPASEALENRRDGI